MPTPNDEVEVEVEVEVVRQTADERFEAMQRRDGYPENEDPGDPGHCRSCHVDGAEGCGHWVGCPAC